MIVTKLCLYCNSTYTTHSELKNKSCEKCKQIHRQSCYNTLDFSTIVTIDELFINDMSYLNKLFYNLCKTYGLMKGKCILKLSMLRILKSMDACNDIYKTAYLTQIAYHFDSNELILTKDEKYYYRPSVSGNILMVFYGDTLPLYIKNHYEELDKACIICGEEYLVSLNPHKIKERSRYTCSKFCYHKNHSMFITETSRLKQSNTMKMKILQGDFTPNQNNSNTHWDTVYYLNNIAKPLRSSWEAVYLHCNQLLLYEYIRIPYVDEYNKTRIYIADFYDEDTRTIIEIKPKAKLKEFKFKLKGLKEFCYNSGYNYEIVTEDGIKKLCSAEVFDDILLNQPNGVDIVNKLRKVGK